MHWKSVKIIQIIALFAELATDGQSASSDV